MKRKWLLWILAVFALLCALAALIPSSRWEAFGGHTVADGPLSGRVLVIDAGHGGFDGGAKGRYTGKPESPINLSIAKHLRKNLEKLGAHVIMTRETESALAKTKRADMEKRWDIISQSGVDAAISIHLNCFPNPRPNGPFVFYYKGSAEGKRLAKAVQDALNDALGSANRPPKEEAYFVLRAGNTTCILVECGFLSNPGDEAKLVQPKHQELLAQVIAQGIVSYFADPQRLPPVSERPELQGS